MKGERGFWDCCRDEGVRGCGGEDPSHALGMTGGTTPRMKKRTSHGWTKDTALGVVGTGRGLVRLRGFILAVFVALFEIVGMQGIPEVRAAEGVMTVEIPVEIDLAFDEAERVFKGAGSLMEFSDDEHLHRLISVLLPDSFEMTTPRGLKDAPEGTVVTYDGQMSARRGFYNKTHDGGYDSTISVSVPLTEEFKEYGEGEYSLTVPVEFTAYQAYGSYTSDYVFSAWDDLISKGLIEIEEDMLKSSKQETDVLEIDPSITKLGNLCLSYPASYREVDVPASVTSATYAFNNSKVRVAYFEGSVIPDRTCAFSPLLEKVVLAEGVTTFGDYAFSGCDILRDFSFPSTMTTLGLGAFSDCPGLKELTIRTDLTVKNSTAAGSPLSNTGIERVVVLEGVTQIPGRLYCNAAALKELVLPSTLQKIGGKAFSECTSLDTVIIKSNVETGSIYSPFDAGAVRTMVFTEGVTTVAKSFMKNASIYLTDVYIPVSMVKISKSAFEGGSNITVHYAGTAEQWAKVALNGFSPVEVIYGDGYSSGMLGANMMASPLSVGVDMSLLGVVDEDPDNSFEDAELQEGEEALEQDFGKDVESDLEDSGADSDAVTPVLAGAVVADDGSRDLDDLVRGDGSEDSSRALGMTEEAELGMTEEIPGDDSDEVPEMDEEPEEGIVPEELDDDTDSDFLIEANDDLVCGDSNEDSLRLHSAPVRAEQSFPGRFAPLGMTEGVEVDPEKGNDDESEEDDDEDEPLAPSDSEDSSLPLKDPDDEILEDFEVTGRPVQL